MATTAQIERKLKRLRDGNQEDFALWHALTKSLPVKERAMVIDVVGQWKPFADAAYDNGMKLSIAIDAFHSGMQRINAHPSFPKGD